MFKELALKVFKFIAASMSILVAAYTLGWSGAITLHNLFKAEKAEAQRFVVERISQTESKWERIREADNAGIHGKMDILIGQNKLIISQNYRTRKVIESKINDE